MAFADLSIVGFLKTKMQWHQARQKVLAENIANADTPLYKARDLKPMSFERTLSSIGSGRGGLVAARTHSAHLTGASSVGGGSQFRTRAGSQWEVTPEGNAVVLEEQMMKLAENQFEYQLATSLYTRSIGLIKTALGRRS